MRGRIGAIATLVVTLATLPGVPPAWAAGWPVPRGPSHEPAPYRYDPARWKAVPRAFLEDASACVLYSGVTHLVEADGTVETVTHEITRLSGRKAIEKLGEYRNISYDPSYQTCTLNEARVHKADGRVVPIEPRHVQLRDVSTDFYVYDHEKQVVISFPSLEIGDVIEVKWTARGKNPEHQGHFFTRYDFGDDQYPVVLDELRVRLPRGRALKYATVGGHVEPAVRDEGGWRTYHWRVANRRELPRDDNLPPRDELRLEVACSTFASWDDVGRWKTRLRGDCWECTPAVREVVRDVTRGLRTPLDKARALTYWVRRHVRYVSVGEKHDYTPHAPGYVLATRFGDCKDQGQLLAAMLREAGVPVALATLGTPGDGQVVADVPSPWGTHAILLITLDGKDHWIDTTVSQAGWDFLPRDDCGRLCYVVDAPPGRADAAGTGNVRLVRTPALTADANRIEQETQVWVGPDGSSRCERSVRYTGLAAVGQRDDWAEAPPGERRRLVAADLQTNLPRARLARVAIGTEGLRDPDRPVSARLEFVVPDQFRGDADHEGSIADAAVWNRLLSTPLDYDRSAPFDLGAPFVSVHRYHLHLPPAYRLETTPKDQAVASAWGSFTVRVRAAPNDPHRLDVRFRLRLERARVEPREFDAFRKFQEEVGKAYRVWLSLKPTQDLADAPLLEAVATFMPGDSDSALVLARLYQQNGRPRDARRVLQRARSYRPECAALWELTVHVAADVKEEEAAYRELVRRFPGEPKYAVALGEALVDRGDHAAAKAVLEPLTRTAPDATRGAAHYQLARSCARQNQPAPALEHLEAAARANAESVAGLAALKLKGRLLQELGRHREAAAGYREVLQADPDSTEALAALTDMELAADRRQEALGYLRRYTVAVGDDPEGLARAATRHLRLGRYEEAQDLAARSLDQGANPEADRVLGLVSLHRHDYDQAVEHLARVGRDAEAVAGLVQACIARGDLTRAQREWQQAKALKPTPALTEAGALVTALVRRRDAVRKQLPAAATGAAADKALDRFVCAEQARAAGRPTGEVEKLLAGCFPDGVELGPAFGLRGLMAIERGRLTAARPDAERAVALSPREATGFYVRGRVRFELGAGDALADLRRAAELTQNKDPAVLHWLAAALLRAGRPADALPLQQQAARMRPNDAEVRDQLREIERAAGSRKAER